MFGRKIKNWDRMLGTAVGTAVLALGIYLPVTAQQQDQRDQQKRDKQKKDQPAKAPDAPAPAAPAPTTATPIDRSGRQRQIQQQQQQQSNRDQQRRDQQQKQQQEAAQQLAARQEAARQQAVQQQQKEDAAQQDRQRRSVRQPQANDTRIVRTGPLAQGQGNDQRRQQLNQQQQQRLLTFRQENDRQDRLSAQRSAQLKQQNRNAQYQFQQQYLENRRRQIQEQNARAYDYNQDQNFYAAANYRYSRGGRSYQINQYGADLLRSAVNNGYEEGFQAGQADRQDRWRNGRYQDSYAYQDASYGYNGYYVEQSEYSYYFRQGFQRGYDDGYNSRSQYGDYSNGNHSILGAVLQTVLDLAQF